MISKANFIVQFLNEKTLYWIVSFLPPDYCLGISKALAYSLFPCDSLVLHFEGENTNPVGENRQSFQHENSTKSSFRNIAVRKYNISKLWFFSGTRRCGPYLHWCAYHEDICLIWKYSFLSCFFYWRKMRISSIFTKQNEIWKFIYIVTCEYFQKKVSHQCCIIRTYRGFLSRDLSAFVAGCLGIRTIRTVSSSQSDYFSSRKYETFVSSYIFFRPNSDGFYPRAQLFGLLM